MSLIDANNLLAFIKEDSRLVASCGEEHTADDIISIIMTAPPIDAEPVRHGRWEMSSDIPDYIICSRCCAVFDVWKADMEQYHYCPNCGAKMDLEED
jgi:hypothetical protein